MQNEWTNIKDREVRAKNVMFTNIAESENSDKEIRKQDDVEIIKTLLGGELEIDMDQIKIINAIRVGARSQDRPRLLKILFEDEKMASTVVKSAKKLSESDNVDINGIKMFRDMSKKDHEKRKALVEEMKKRNGDLEASGDSGMKWIIKGTDIIKVRKANFH